VPESLDAIAARNSQELKSIDAATPALEQAKASCAARNRLLSDNPSPENTAQLLFDPNQLANEVAAEIEALANGDNPYANRKGDYWRVLQAGAKESPMRVYLPESADPSKPLPLVVAFHGAGGDENMFMDAYGAGVIKETADQHGFLLVTPRTYDYGGNNIGEMFDALIEAVGYDYDIDPSRIYVLGHSMGGGATNNLINARPNMIAAAAPICGFRQLTTSAEETPPTLVIAAELDPLARPARVEPGAQKAIDAGLPVEYKLIKNYGHTLVVGDIMHDTIDWLLKHDRE
jgi:predicted esterase